MILRKTESLEYELKYSQRPRMGYRYHRGVLRVYAPVDTPAETADQYADRVFITLRIMDALEKAKGAEPWPACLAHNRRRFAEKPIGRRHGRSR